MIGFGMLSSFGLVTSHRGVTMTCTAGVCRFRDPLTGERQSFGHSRGGRRGAEAYIDQALAQRQVAGFGALGNFSDTMPLPDVARALAQARGSNAAKALKRIVPNLTVLYDSTTDVVRVIGCEAAGNFTLSRRSGTWVIITRCGKALTPAMTANAITRANNGLSGLHGLHSISVDPRIAAALKLATGPSVVAALKGIAPSHTIYYNTAAKVVNVHYRDMDSIPLFRRGGSWLAFRQTGSPRDPGPISWLTPEQTVRTINVALALGPYGW